MFWKETIRKIAEEKRKRLEKIERLYEKTVHRLGIKKVKQTALNTQTKLLRHHEKAVTNMQTAFKSM